MHNKDGEGVKRWDYTNGGKSVGQDWRSSMMNEGMDGGK